MPRSDPPSWYAAGAKEDRTVGVGILTLIGAIVVVIIILRLLGLW